MAKLIRLSTPIDGDEWALVLRKEEVEAVQSMVGRVGGSDEGRGWTDKVWYAIGEKEEFKYDSVASNLVYRVTDLAGTPVNVRLIKE